MMFLDDFGLDAPIADTPDDADQTDVYAYYDPTPSGTDVVPTDTLDLSVVLAAEEEADQAAGATATVDFGADDVFVFLSGGAGHGSAVSDNSAPAPEPEEPDPSKYGWQYERDNIGTARHTVTGAMLQRMLIYG